MIRNLAALRDVVEFDDRCGKVRIRPLDSETARWVFAHCIYGLGTVLQGSSITEDELWVAADNGMRIATLAPVPGDPAST